MSEDTMDARVQQAWDDSFDRQVLRDLLPGLNVHPDDVITLLRYAPLALTHLTWRNTVLEDWHADGRIHDPDMFRSNADTTLIFQQALWSAFGEQIGSGDLASLDDLIEEDVEAFEAALYDACAEGFHVDRRLPNGMTLGELAQGELDVLQEHASTQIGALAAKAGELGVDVVLLFLAIRGRLACDRWWGSPKWPTIVDKFIALLRDPTDEWWHADHRHFPQRGRRRQPTWPISATCSCHGRTCSATRPQISVSATPSASSRRPVAVATQRAPECRAQPDRLSPPGGLNASSQSVCSSPAFCHPGNGFLQQPCHHQRSPDGASGWASPVSAASARATSYTSART